MTADSERAWYQHTWDKAIRHRTSSRSDRIPELNSQLLLETMAHIESQPDSHDQSMWATRTECGTKFCFAGHAVARAIPDSRPNFDSEPGDAMTGAVILPNGVSESYDEVARQVLGITDTESLCLFSATNAVGNLRELVDQLVEAERVRLADG